MAIARSLVVEEGVSGWYHCVSRIVQRAHLLFDGRREWLEQRVDRLQAAFTICDAAHAFMANHMHLVMHVQPHLADAWSAEEVVRRWSLVYPNSVMAWGGTPVRRGEQPPAEVPNEVVAAVARDASMVDELRRRLTSLSWFMKALKEPLARMANREAGVTGHFWEGRFKCRRILDVPGLLACMIYVDLNPIRAGVVDSLAASAFTSIRRRLDALRVFARSRELKAALPGASTTVLQSKLGAPLPTSPESPTLAPIGDDDATGRDGLLGSLSPERYVALAEASGRTVRPGKRGRIPESVAPILRSLAIDVNRWVEAIRSADTRPIEPDKSAAHDAAKPKPTPTLRGSVIGSRSARYREAYRRGCKWVVGALDISVDDKGPTA